MLYITLSDGQEIQWHCGDRRPGIWQSEDNKSPARTVIEVQADGDELDHVLRCFTGIPVALHGNLVDQPVQSVQTWFGDHARFIARHLC